MQGAKGRKLDKSGGQEGISIKATLKQYFHRQEEKIKLDLPIKRKTLLLLGRNIMVKSIFGEDESNISTYKTLENKKTKQKI